MAKKKGNGVTNPGVLRSSPPPGQIPGFETAASEADWFTATLGGVNIPGVVTIQNLKVGIDCDTKKSKGDDQPTSTDNGLDAATFEVRVWMNSQHFAAWQAVLPHFNPRRPGRQRSPLEILHPMTDELGIRYVRVLHIESEQPTGAKGWIRILKCQEWFDKPKPIKKGIKPEDARQYPNVSEAIALGGNTLGTVGLKDAVGRDIVGPRGAQDVLNNSETDPNTLKSLDPASEESVLGSVFGGDFAGTGN